MELNGSNILYFIAYVAPVFVLSLIVLIGILNGNVIASCIFIVTMLLLTFISTMMQKSLNVKSPGPKQAVCSVFGYDFFMVPSMSSLIIMASIVYLCLPFIFEGQVSVYGPLLSVLTVLYIIDFVVKYNSKCTNILGIVLGSFTGLTLGGIVTCLLYSFYKNGLFLTRTHGSNNTTCSKPSNTKYKCSVYKNGQLIKQT